jgi:hypothetical protein
MKNLLRKNGLKMYRTRNILLSDLQLQNEKASEMLPIFQIF